MLLRVPNSTLLSLCSTHTRCPPNMSTRKVGSTQATQCIAAPGYVMLTTTKVVNGVSVVSVEAVRCPASFNCSVGSATMESLPLLPGFWRASYNTFNARPCHTPAYCVGGVMYNSTEVAAAQADAGAAAAASRNAVDKRRPADAVCAPGQ